MNNSSGGLTGSQLNSNVNNNIAGNLTASVSCSSTHLINNNNSIHNVLKSPIPIGCNQNL